MAPTSVFFFSVLEDAGSVDTAEAGPERVEVVDAEPIAGGSSVIPSAAAS
jgi:hypothetical protein